MTPPFDAAPTRLDPATTAEQLAELAATRPDLWPAIDGHPNVYPELQQWVADRLAEHAASVAAVSAEPSPVASEPLVGGSVVSEEGAHASFEIAAGLESSGVGAASGDTESSVKTRRTGLMVTVSAVLVVLLGLGGTATVLGLNGTLARWFGGGDSSLSNEAALSFSTGLERKWVADSNDFVTPSVGERGGDFSYLRWAFSRGSIDYVEADMPVASSTAVMFNARGKGSRLVMLDAASGDSLLNHDLGGLNATCAVDGYSVDEPFYCVAAHDQQERSTLFRVDRRGTLSEQQFDVPLHRATVGRDRIVLSGDFGSVVAIDRGGRELWKRTDLANGSFAGVDIGADRTLLRGMNGWTLLGGNGSTLASAKVVSVYDNGDGGCDARLTESGKLFVTADDSCVNNVAGINWWGFGKNLEGISVFSSEGRDYVVRTGDGSTELMRFPEDPGSRLETVTAMDTQAGMVGVVEGDQPALVLRGPEQAQTIALADGRVLASWAPSNTPREDSARLLDTSGTVLIGTTAYNALSGTPLWRLDARLELGAAWKSKAGLVVLGGGCPECSSAGGATSLSTLTLYTPEFSGGTLVSTPIAENGGRGDQVGAAVPSFIPACPGTTKLLAWAEISDGWIVVCGVDGNTPSFVALKSGPQGKVVTSFGSAQPGSSDARQAVSWNASEQRFTAKLEDGTRVTLDYRLGTATVVDQTTNTTQWQSLMIRYVFVPMGTAVRTSLESAGKEGAFGVETPKETAVDQVRYLQQVIERAYEGRALVKEALPKLAGCTAGKGGYTDTIAQMEVVRDNRAALLQALDSMPVDKIPEGAKLLDHLREAIQASHQANVEYVAWAQAANASGCAQLSAAGQAAAAASDPPKEQFAKLWNSVIAPQFGVRTFDAWYI